MDPDPLLTTWTDAESETYILNISVLHSTVEEIISLSQYELAPEMAAVVDSHCALYVWLGAYAAPRAKDDARALAKAYLAQGLW